jgi:hypothetical protein
VILRAVGVPTRTSRVKPISTRVLVGSLAGLATLVLLPLLVILAVRRIIDLRRTRPHLATGQAVGDRLAASGGLAPIPAGPTADLRRLLGLDGLRRGVLSGVGAGTPHIASGRWSEGTRVYHRSRSRRPLTIALAVLLLGAAGAAAVYAATRAQTSTPASHKPRVVHRPRAVPTVPIVVLNATSTPGAAHDLALALQARHVPVRAVGNVTETLPPGTEILYAAGERRQAQLLAKILSGRSPTVAPIDPVTSAAAAGAKLVVVIA